MDPLTTLIKRFNGSFGFKLPFGFYTGVTSTFAVLTNPIVMFPLLIGGGALLMNQQNKSLKKKSLPIILLQLTLPYMNEDGENGEFDPFIQEWAKRYNEYRSYLVNLERIETSKRS